MKINEVLKAINLRVVSSNITNKIYYEDARELFFSDCYNNTVGSFIASTISEDVFEIIIKVDIHKSKNKVFNNNDNIFNNITNILKELKTTDNGKNNLELSSDDEKEESCYDVYLHWVNPIFREKRQYALKKIKERLSTLSKKNDFNTLLLSDDDKKINKIIEEESNHAIESSSTILEVVKKVCDGLKVIEDDIVKNNALSDDEFLQISKIAYKEDVSVRQLIDKLSKSGLSINDFNNLYEKKFKNKEDIPLSMLVSKEANNFNIDYGFSMEHLDNYKVGFKKENNNNVSDFNINEEDSKTIQQVKVETANDNKDIVKNKKGLLRESKNLIVGEKLPDYINGIFETKKGFVKSSPEKEIYEDRKMSLKERINPTINKTDDLFHKQVDGKIYLSNLKVKKII